MSWPVFSLFAALSPPANVTILTTTRRSFTVSWSAATTFNETVNITGYEIDYERKVRDTDFNNVSKLVEVQNIGDEDEVAFTISRLSPGRTYSVKVLLLTTIICMH